MNCVGICRSAIAVVQAATPSTRDDAQTVTRTVMTMFMKAISVEEAFEALAMFVKHTMRSLAQSDMTDAQKLKQLLNDLGCDVEEGDKLTQAVDACCIGRDGVTRCMHGLFLWLLGPSDCSRSDMIPAVS
jgi:type II secretory pathway component PulF